MGPDLPAKWVSLGRVVGVYGIKGWVKIESHTRPRDAIFDYSPWGLGSAGNWNRREVLDGQVHGKSLIASLEGISDRDQAREFVGAEIAVPREALPNPDEGEFYWADLVGCSVINLDDRELGKVTGLMETGANDVLIIAGETEHLVPYTDQVIKDINLDQKLIRVDWDIDF